MKFEKNAVFPSQILSSLDITGLPKGLKIAKSLDDIKRIEDFREGLFSPLYPGMTDFHDDVHDAFSLVLYTENQKGNITSTARVVFDSPTGLPADEYANDSINERRKAGLKLAEVSRFAISDEARDEGLLPVYYQAFFTTCAGNGIDSMIIIINGKSVRFHQKRVGATLLIEDIGHNYGRDDLTFSCLDWSIHQTKPSFFKWVGLELTKVLNKEEELTEEKWNDYSYVFTRVLTQVQRDLYIDASHNLSGKVLDLGCGSARLAAYLADNQKVTHYTGIEYAHSMVKLSDYTLQQLARPEFTVRHQKVEDISLEDIGGQFDSAVSLQSYYAWKRPEKALANIFSLLLPSGLFVLATVNYKLDQEKLFIEAKKDLMWHPDYATFKAYNLEFASHPEINYVTMDELIKHVQAVGFEVVKCHQDHYAGGLNFLVCQKPK